MGQIFSFSSTALVLIFVYFLIVTVLLLIVDFKLTSALNQAQILSTLVIWFWCLAIRIFALNTKFSHILVGSSLFKIAETNLIFPDFPLSSYSSKILVKKNSFAKKKKRVRKHYCKR